MPIHRLIIGVTALVALVPAASPSAQPDAGLQQMHVFLRTVHSLRADFTQVVLDPNLQQMKQSVGTLAIKRPNRFRWDYATPNKEIIVADGRRVWIYDVELKQVTVKPLNGTLSASPAVLLSGSNDVRKNFKVKDLGTRRGLDWVGLTPRIKDTDFDDVKLGFRDNLVVVMELKDVLGNRTRITFSHVQVNPAIPASAFEFTPPAGTDVIGDRRRKAGG